MTQVSNKRLLEQYDIIAIGPFDKHQIHIEYNPKHRLFSEEMKAFIESEWNETRKKYPGMFDGPLYDLRNLHAKDDELHMVLSDTSYKTYVGTRNEKFRTIFSAESAVNPLSVGTIVITSDEKCIIGVRGGHVDSYHGQYGTIAGYMEAGTDMTENLPDPFITMTRELEEESGVEPASIKQMVCLGLTGTYQTLMAYKTAIEMTSQEFLAHTPTEFEFTEFKILNLDRNSIHEFIRSENARIAPYCLANLMLLGINEFGMDWVI